MSDGTTDFRFWDIIRENWPKMDLKCAIFKIFPKLAQKDIYMKQVPSKPILGIVSAKKWSPFLDLGV